MLFSFSVLPSIPSLLQNEGTGRGSEQNHINLSMDRVWRRQIRILPFFFFFFCSFFHLSVPLVGNPEKCVLFFSLDLTKARSLLKIASFPVVSNSISAAGLHFQPQYLVNTQFLDTLVSQVHWGHLEPLASFTEERGFLGSLCLQPFSTDIKGPLSSFEGCDHCQNPHKPGPWGMLSPAGPHPHQKRLDCRGSLYMELAEFPWMKGRLI